MKRPCQYAGCKLEAEDSSEFCIFHSPNPKDSEKFKQALNDQINREGPEENRNERNWFTGYVFPADTEVRSVFGDATFEGGAWFNDATFEGGAWFDGVTFKGAARFIGAKFKHAVFNDATFEGGAWFDGATFEGGAWFDDATFKAAWFKDTKFKAAWFRKATFGAAKFGGVTFEGSAVFKGATFKGDAWFDDATFEGNAWFDDATFEGGAWFKGATFEGNAWFDDATFKDAWFGGVTFKDAWFGGVTFKGDARLTGATFKDAVFNDATFESAAEFDGVTFKGDARFDGVTFKGDVGFTRCEAVGLSLGQDRPRIRGWSEEQRCGVVFIEPRAAVSFWRFAQRTFGKAGERERADAAFYFKRVKHWKELRQTKGFKRLWNWIIFLLDLVFVRWTTAYGASVARVFFAWFAVIGGFGITFSTLPRLIGRA